MNPIDPSTVRRLLIRVNNWIGDVVMISPAVRALRARFHGARIAILAKRWVLESLRGDPYYDDLIEYDSEGLHRGLSGRLRLAASLRGQGFDLAVLFQKAFEAAALAFLAGARYRVGYATDSRSLLLTHALEPPSADVHHAEAFLGIARSLGCAIDDPIPSYHLREQDRHEARSILTRLVPGGRSPMLAFHPGASKAPRAWHPARFVELGKRLVRRHDARILVLGSADERPLVRQISSSLPPGHAFVPDPGLSIKVTAALIEACDLFVGNDSGPMHIAAALGVPTVAIFGPGSPSRTSPIPRDGPVVVIGKDYPCSPCRQHFFHECPPAPEGRPFCLAEIRVEDVQAAADDLLSGDRRPET